MVHEALHLGVWRRQSPDTARESMSENNRGCPISGEQTIAAGMSLPIDSRRPHKCSVSLIIIVAPGEPISNNAATHGSNAPL